MTQANLNRVMDTFEYLEPTIRVKKRRPNNWEELVYPNFVPSTAKTVAHITLDHNGRASEITGKEGEKLDAVGFSTRKDEIEVVDIGFSLNFDLQDEKAMLQGDVNPMEQKINAAFLMERLTIFNIVVNGGGFRGMTGFSNAEAGKETGQIRAFTTPTTKWTASGITGDSILDDLNRLYNGIGENTDGVSPANTMFIPLQALQVARTKKIANSSDSALRVFLESVQDATGQPFLVRQNQAFENDIFMGSYGEDFARINIAQTLLFGDIQTDGWGYKIPCRIAVSGLELLDSFAFGRMNGVIAPAATP
ncbi:MAG: DUF2184 domain-containing protein [Gammaproteobacteria bacterium]|nr:DUF2184 domain-containing protein [Gammaproteobacteria bacterium]